MRTASDLAKLHDAVQFRLQRIGNRYASVSLRPAGDQDAVITHCVMELDNLNLGALRAFTVSTLSRARTLNGGRVTLNRHFASEEEVSAHILSVVNSVRFANQNRPAAIAREDEPTVRDPLSTERILQVCGTSNLPSVATALALNPTVFRDLATVRNFYAHRKENTWVKVRNQARNLGVRPFRHPRDVVMAFLAGRPVTVFEDWVAESQLFFEELMR